MQARNEAQATLEEVKAEIEVVEGRSKKAAEALSAAQTRLQVPPPCPLPLLFFSSILLSRLELSDTKVYEP